MSRTPGLRGRLPVKPPAERFAISWLGDYLRAPLPAPVYPIDVTGGIAPDAWAMLGNGADPTCTTYPNGVGDCGYAAREHARRSKAACYGLTETWETSDQLVAEYLAYDHGQDVGVNLADVLLAWYHSGRVAAFAPVDHTNPAAVDAAMAAFKGVIVGVNLTDDAEQLFGEGLPWTVANGERPDPAAGHAILKVRADGHALDGYITWGALQAATTAWSAAAVEEIWAVLTTEDETAKVDLAALRADIDALHGTGGSPPAPVPVPPVPVTPPAPAPAPVVPHPPPPPPAPADLLHQLAAKVRAVAAAGDRDLGAIMSWLHQHGI